MPCCLLEVVGAEAVLGQSVGDSRGRRAARRRPTARRDTISRSPARSSVSRRTGQPATSSSSPWRRILGTRPAARWRSEPPTEQIAFEQVTYSHGPLRTGRRRCSSRRGGALASARVTTPDATSRSSDCSSVHMPSPVQSWSTVSIWNFLRSRIRLLTARGWRSGSRPPAPGRCRPCAAPGAARRSRAATPRP